MAEQNRTDLKTYFEIGDRPTQQQFADLIDSVINKLDDGISIDNNNNMGIGTDNPSEKLEVVGRIRDETGYVMPAGGIIMWSGSVANIPQGWVLCNDNNGTPDLSGRFIVGSGGGYNPGDTGGHNEITLTLDEMPEHNHRLQDGIGGNIPNSIIAGGDPNLIGMNNSNGFVGDPYIDLLMEKTGGNQPHENRPPYYALCFIMKL